MRGATMPKIDDNQSQSSQDDSCLQTGNEEEDHVFDMEKSPSLPPMPAILPSRRKDADRVIEPKQSFQSIASNSTLSERTNYKVYGQSSPCPVDRRISYEFEEHGDFADDDASFAPSSRQSLSNYQILAESSDVESIREQKRPFTSSSDVNFVRHGRSVSCSSLIPGRSPLRPEFSQESLLVAPLRPTKRNSFDNGSIVKSCSGESLRRASLSSIGSSFSQEATRSLFIGAASVVYIQGGLRKQKSRLMASGSGTSSSMVPAHPHRWSAPLSTVMSESEGGSVAPSRSLSPWSGTDRRSSNNSRHVLSMSSSLAGLDDMTLPPSHSRSASLEYPPVALHTRSSGRDLMGSMRQIRDYDEHGDGLADLDVQLHHRASRSRLASEHALRHSASTRSLNPLSFPAWARLYYCSGERRFLVAQASSDSIRSLYNGSLYNEQPPPGKAFMRHSPSLERIQHNAPLPSRAVVPQSLGAVLDPKNDQNEIPRPTISEIGPCDEETPSRVASIVRRVKKQTSSIWSPHLHLDRRASRYNIWGPPPEEGSEGSGFDWLRNRQTALFVAGFILPFLWIVAAFLPLPPKPVLEMTQQQHNSTSHLDFTHGNDSSQAIHSANETRYNTARWWRNLNRVMAIVGLLVIGAVIALIIVGVKQQWTRRS
ncbi:unnamed protein product [Clonostachys rosea f. rosea IK726]|uniref:Uncharacterized protein n=1 Tax=Clonostachys rosea f. rosea IK726 TaxID=1349383 RepID=A0ACA9TUB2_BIOOC|nr:unnamed protein product [Clonostachys rosea f. rosea IK726]